MYEGAKRPTLGRGGCEKKKNGNTLASSMCDNEKHALAERGGCEAPLVSKKTAMCRTNDLDSLHT